MGFTSLIFLFLFLPLSLALFYAVRTQARVVPLVIVSLGFYAWGEPLYVFLMMATGAATFAFGRTIARATQPRRKALLIAAIVTVLVPLAVVKYGDFALQSLGGTPRLHLALPIGISFFTFMAIGYLVDIYRDSTKRARGIVDFAAFLFMFPHLVAGPIINWRDIGPQLRAPKFDAGDFSYGAVRVTIGLLKKLMIADRIAPLADLAFATDAPGSLGSAWLGAVLFGLQIYFDFSAYSDIAIGLAAMMGIRFAENFNFPYRAVSARDFWRRWHISLSTWFRDYVYFPLGGSRVRPLVVWRNLAVVWLLTGLWHGAAWTFVLWGAYFGLIIGLEHFLTGATLARLPRLVQHSYALVIALMGWVIFRAQDIDQAGRFLAGMWFYPTTDALWDDQAAFILRRGLVVVLVGVILASGVGARAMEALRVVLTERSTDTYSRAVRSGVALATVGVVAGLVVAAALIVGASSHPFIYLRF